MSSHVRTKIDPQPGIYKGLLRVVNSDWLYTSKCESTRIAKDQGYDTLSDLLYTSSKEFNGLRHTLKERVHFFYNG